MPEPCQPPYQRLQERWRLSHEQQALRTAVTQDIAERWPRLNFEVMPVSKTLSRGELVIPEDDAWFAVGYQNGPLLMDMREVIAGRTRICSRFPTIGSILWVEGQSTWRAMLGGAGREVIRPFDLSVPKIMAEINAIDAWAHELGMSEDGIAQEEGWIILFAAQRFAREAGRTWPKVTDAHVPTWDWRQAANDPRRPR